MSAYVIDLASTGAALEAVGGKGASLARLYGAGFPVPGGFHITTAAYRRFVAEGGLGVEIAGALEGANADRPESLEEAARRIREAFLSRRVPADIVSEIEGAYTALGREADAPVAVRSSATAEDLPGLSFAGQQESFLDVRGKAGVLDAVRRCWASLWTGRAVAYRLKMGFADEAIALAVVVQLLVDADAAGVLFTADPTTGRRDRVVIDAAWGLGEAVVGGRVTPDVVVVDKATRAVLERTTADKAIRTVRRGGHTEEERTPDELRRVPVLQDAAASALAAIGVEVESLYGMPMDVEWARENGRFFVLQARPITALPEEEPPAPTEWTPPDPKARYARASIADFLPDPLSPLFATLGVRLYREGFKSMFREMTGSKKLMEGYDYVVTINGYLYTSMGFGRMSDALTILFRGLRKILWTMRHSEIGWRRDHDVYEAAVGAWEKRDEKTMRPAELLEGVEALWAAAARYIAGYQTGAMTAAAAEALMTRTWEKWMRKPGEPPAPALLLGYESAPTRADDALWALAVRARRAADLKAWLAGSPARGIAAQVRRGEAPGGVDPERWASFRKDFLDYLERHGRAVYELDFSVPVPCEEPEGSIVALKHWLDGGSDPAERRAGSAGRRERLAAEVQARARGLRGWLFGKLLRWAQSTVPLRENAISGFGLGFPSLRRLLLELGSRLARAGAVRELDDVFYLEESELREAVSRLEEGVTPAGYGDLVRSRRLERRARKRVTPPPTVPAVERVMGFKVSAFLPASGGEQGLLKGVAASGGKATAPARILSGPEDFARMQAGEVLVADITTPAWTPLFALASAVITNTGGPLSHGSIVAREYGIPAVLGTGSATRRLKDGDVVTVDGDAGTVTWREVAAL